MPGIAGVLCSSLGENNYSIINRMLKPMMHAEQYSSNSYTNNDLSLCVGWTSRPGEFSECMPITNKSNDLILILAGEVFLDPLESEGLINSGHFFNNDKANILIRLYEEIGDSFFEKLNGNFSGLLIDLRQKTVVLFNDRYGMYRVFVHESKDGFYFASEAKALLKVLPETRSYDPIGLAQFMTCGCTISDNSLFNKISVLPPASKWILTSGGKHRKKTSYFKPSEWENQNQLEEKRILPLVLESFGTIISRYVAGDLPVGVSLTGGLDSRMVMACLNHNSFKFPCFTFGSPYRATFDVQVAREVAKTCGQIHHELVLDDNFINDFPNHLEKAIYISDGYIGLSGAAELYGNAKARNIVTVRLTGNCGGELLRGDRAFKTVMPQDTLITSSFLPYLKEAQKTFQLLETANPITFALFHQFPSQGYGRTAIERSQVILRSPFMDNDLAKLIYQAPHHILQGEKLSLAIISRYNPALLKIPTDRGILHGELPWKSFTRRFYREALFKAEYWSAHGMPNWLAFVSGYGTKNFLEKSFIGRHKFQHFTKWSRESLKEYLSDTLLQGSEIYPEFFNRSEVEKMVILHMSGQRNYINEIDKLLTIILTSRKLLSSSE